MELNGKEIAIIAIVLALTFGLAAVPMESAEGFLGWGGCCRFTQSNQGTPSGNGQAVSGESTVTTANNFNFQNQDNSGSNAAAQ